MSRWFRFYDGALDDPKVQQLPDAAFRCWVNLLCVASRQGGMISDNMGELSFRLRKPIQTVRNLVQTLLSVGLLEHCEGGYEPHNWRSRQYQTDVADPTNAVRQQRYRDRHRVTDEEALRVTEETVTDTVTPKRPDTEQIQSRTDTEKKTSLRSVQKTTMPDGCPSDEDRRKALEYWASKQRPDLDVAEQASAFRVHCQANGKKYVDWSSAWQTWYVRAIEFNRPKPPTQSMGSKVISILDVEAKRGSG